MASFVDPLASFNIGAFGAVKDKDWEKGCMHESGTSKEQGPQNWIFSFLPIFCMEKPDASINSESKATLPIWIGFKPFLYRKFCQGTGCGSRPKKLGII